MFATITRRLAPLLRVIDALSIKIARHRRFQLFATLLIGTLFGAISVGLIGAEPGADHHGPGFDRAAQSAPYSPDGDSE